MCSIPSTLHDVGIRILNTLLIFCLKNALHSHAHCVFIVHSIKIGIGIFQHPVATTRQGIETSSHIPNFHLLDSGK